MALRFLSPIHRASRNFAIFLEGPCNDAGLGKEEAHMLSYLASYAPKAVGDLRKVFGVKGSTLTSQLDRLEKAGMIARVPNPDDRRSFLIDATPLGKVHTKKLGKTISALEKDISGRVSEKDIAAFQRVIEAIQDACGRHLG